MDEKRDAAFKEWRASKLFIPGMFEPGDIQLVFNAGWEARERSLTIEDL